MFLNDTLRRLRTLTLRPRVARQGTAIARQRSTEELTRLAEQLCIPCPSPTTEDVARDHHRARGQFLARQERWQELVSEVMQADRDRAMTPAAMPVAELLCFGARADVVSAVEHALVDGKPARNAPLLAGIEALEEMLAEAPTNPVRAVIVAQAHMDIGWAWRGSDWVTQVPTKNQDAFEAHFDRAREILSECGNFPFESYVFAAASCALNARGIAPNARLAQEYERLIDLNPLSPGPMRALGGYLSPRWYGSSDQLELEARRTAARTCQTWGAGGYAWVLLDTIAAEQEVCAQLDVEFFIEGLSDILDRMPDQHTANTLAAFCAVTLGSRRFVQPQAEAHRAEITACSDWIVRNHVTELHPLIWAHAASGFDNALRVPSSRRFAVAGRQSGMHKIAELFSKEIENGHRIVFTVDGPVAEAG